MHEFPAPPREELPSPGRPINRLALVFSGAVVLYFIISVLLGWLLGSIWPAYDESPWAVWLIYLGGMLILLPFCTLLLPDRAVTAPSPRVKPSVGAMVKAFVIGLGMLYTVSIMTQILVELLSRLRGAPIENPAASDFVLAGILPDFLFGCIFVAFAEEYLFRYLVLRTLRDFGDGLCIFVSGLLFGLFHMNLHQIFYAFVLGALFAYITRKTGTVLYAMVFHGLINFFGLILLPFLEEYGGTTGVMAGSLLVLGSILGGFLLFALSVSAIKFDPGPLPLSAGRKMGIFFSRPGVIVYLILCVAATTLIALASSIPGV